VLRAVRGAVGRLAGSHPAPTPSTLQLAILVATLGINVMVAWYETAAATSWRAIC